MSQIMKAALAVCLAFGLAAQADAGTVRFAGTVAPASGPFPIGTPIELAAIYTPTAGLVAPVTSAVLTVGGETWEVLAAGTNEIEIIPNGPGPDDLAVTLNFAPSDPGGLGPDVSELNLLIFGGDHLGPGASTDGGDLSLIHQLGDPGSGTLSLLDTSPFSLVNVSFSGTAVPEPGSVALLSGLGLVMAGGIWRRRRKSAQKAA